MTNDFLLQEAYERIANIPRCRWEIWFEEEEE